MDDLLLLLSQLSEHACRLLLDGRVTLPVAQSRTAPAVAPRDYVDAILGEVRHMPDDLRPLFLNGSLTIRQVRTEMLSRSVASNRISRSTAALYETCSVDLATISAS